MQVKNLFSNAHALVIHVNVMCTWYLFIAVEACPIEHPECRAHLILTCRWTGEKKLRFL